MTRVDLSIFVDSALNNKRFVLLHALSGTVVIGSTVAFSVLLALYFGIDMFRIWERFPSLSMARDRFDLISVAVLVSLLLLVARVGQSIIEAKVTINREIWFAEQIRNGNIKGTGNLSRASNYYGRLSSSSMKAASTIVVLLINLIMMAAVLPSSYLSGVLSLVFACSVALYITMRTLSASMSSSSELLAETAKHMAAWKQNPSLSYDTSVDQYYSSYFRRIFLSSAFAFSPAVFGLVFCVVLLAGQESGLLSFNLGEAFVAFTLLQAYLGVVGKFFGAFVHGSAFLPAVRPFFLDGAEARGDAEFLNSDEFD